MRQTVHTFPAQPGQVNIFTRLTTLWSYRELIYNLVVRELKARYKNSVLGFVWSLLNPLGMMLVFTVVFGVLLPNTQIEKYPIFLLCGLLPWNYFSASVMGSVNSIVENANLVKKVFFPREVLPIASVLAQLVNFLLALIILFAALIIFRANFSPWLWLLPLVILWISTRGGASEKRSTKELAAVGRSRSGNNGKASTPLTSWGRTSAASMTLR